MNFFSENKENIGEFENTKTNLQQNFAKFRKERHEKFKFKQYLQAAHKYDRNSSEFKTFLRAKFIETAKKYIGVPYAQKYHKPGDKYYDSPLFLDCCGLIRQVVYDLREEFGFTLARWNQAYQFDTLPNSIEFDQMKPGDLIFYSATYYNKNKTVHAHNMVHVEIYMGEESSLGARWHSGVVSIFHSYKFESSNYFNIKFHYKSIETWLSGICRSFCEQHPWRDDRDIWVPDKFSIFADESDQEEKTREENDSKDVISNKDSQPKRVFIGQGNNDKLIRTYFSNEKYLIMNPKESFSSNFYFKWTQTVNEIDFFAFKEGQQIVSHIPNIKIITTKTGLLKTIRDFEEIHKSACDFSKSFLLPSYRLDVLTDEIEFIENTDKDFWIYKPYGNNQGKGIKLMKNITLFKEKFIKSKQFYLSEYSMNKFLCESEKKNIMNPIETNENKESETNDINSINPNAIIQKYLEKPLLLGKRKFDIRCYALIATTKPLLVLFHHGYCRLAIENYTLDIFEENNAKFIHLTNNSIQKKHPKYSEIKEETIWSMERFENYVIQQKISNKEQISGMYNKIKDILAYVMKTANEKITKKQGFYELLGCDFIIDEKLEPFLLEINTNPAIFTDLQVHKEIIPNLMFKMLDLVLEINSESSNINELELILKKYPGFDLIFNEKADKK